MKKQRKIKVRLLKKQWQVKERLWEKAVAGREKAVAHRRLYPDGGAKHHAPAGSWVGLRQKLPDSPASG